MGSSGKNGEAAVVGVIITLGILALIWFAGLVYSMGATGRIFPLTMVATGLAVVSLAQGHACHSTVGLK